MEKCCLCREKITNEDPAILFVGQTGDDKEICSTCERKMDILMESNNPKEIKDGLDFLYTCWSSVNDSEVASFLEEQSVKMSKKRDYFSDKKNQIAPNYGASGWISGMKAFAWILFFGIIIGGIVIAVPMGGGTAFVVIIASFMVAFLSVAMTMIFLNLAQDVSEIKQILQKKDLK